MEVWCFRELKQNCVCFDAVTGEKRRVLVCEWACLQQGQGKGSCLTRLNKGSVDFASTTSSCDFVAPLLYSLSEGLSRRGKLIVLGASMDSIPVTPIQIIGKSRSIVGHASGTGRDSQVGSSHDYLRREPTNDCQQFFRSERGFFFCMRSLAYLPDTRVSRWLCSPARCLPLRRLLLF